MKTTIKLFLTAAMFCVLSTAALADDPTDGHQGSGGRAYQLPTTVSVDAADVIVLTVRQILGMRF